ncbi:pyridoxal-phosphate dependent enzyme [Colletotrichum scovillei]|uniref:pyridoxal-phosphate dependent enzyme n=1 Tax=Colletotrichum scovillei TaxID=1209932 RepID=UPI0015C4038F|nr:pyridoxal-phosphate dependent enzyme [Colletotrichum scovillei]KAF4784857.1 pyridoxal-phosphate dependent enzyme [Colletotrichum scovillei]
MSLSNHPKAYGSAALALAFTAGILVTLGFKDFYPDLERRYQRRRNRRARNNTSTADPSRRSSLFWGPPVQLEDHETASEADEAAAAALLTTLGGSAWNPPLIADGVAGAIGNTPLIKIRSLSEATGRVILAKAEFLNAAGNTPKDRVALSMIEGAEAAGQLVPGRGDTIYEGTVGSTGISLATLARARGYRAHICMPNDMAMEKVDLLRHLGATVERVDPAPIASPEHFFENPANFAAHLHTTGPEIVYQTGGKLDAFVAGAGTGGTIAGVAKYLKEEANVPGLQVVLADPQGSGLYNKIRHGVMYSSTEKEGTRRRTQVDTIVEGIGINRVTENFEAGRELIDDAIKVTDEQACRMARWLVENDGIFAGSSSAVNCVAAVVAASRLPEGSQVVTILCDSGTRHLSKFWKHVAAMGLEEDDHSADLFSVLKIDPAKK